MIGRIVTRDERHESFIIIHDNHVKLDEPLCKVFKSLIYFKKDFSCDLFESDKNILFLAVLKAKLS